MELDAGTLCQGYLILAFLAPTALAWLIVCVFCGRCPQNTHTINPFRLACEPYPEGKRELNSPDALHPNEAQFSREWYDTMLAEYEFLM
jgi:hypothetical protein